MATLRYCRHLLIALLLTGILASGLPARVHSKFDYVHPGDSIQQAINAAAVGDTIFVSMGTYTERFSINKTVHLVGTASGTTFLDGQAQGTVVTVTANNASIAGFTVRNSGVYGNTIQVVNANNVNITNNDISSDLSSGRPSGAGVDLYLSNHTFIDGNTFSHNLFAINITSSNYNRVSNNRVATSNLVGVELRGASSRNLVFQNVFVAGEEGVDMDGSLTGQNNVTRNLFRQMSIAGVFLVYFAHGNLLNENSFELNHIGVDIQNSTGNIFYHNSFLRSGFRHVNHVIPSDMPLNSWDNRTLGALRPGGNYWDNYTGVDTDNDGIGNTNLPANGIDQYPLMNAFVPVPIAVASITPSKFSGPVPFTVTFTADVLGTLKPFAYLWSFGDNTPVSNQTSPSHRYDTPGNYSISVLVKDSTGTSSLGSVTIVALAQAPAGYGYLPVVAVLALAATVFGVLYYRRRRRAGKTVVESSVAKTSRKRKNLSARIVVLD